jgi:hypothetical protein
MPKADAAARAVLAYLAVKSDSNGRNAFPLALSIAHDVGLNPESVPRVLKRLVDYGLISKDGVGPQGQPKWTLHMERQHPEGSFEEFCLRHRAVASARKARYRSGSVHDEQSGTVHDPESGTVHDGESGTEHVHDDASSCPGSSVVMSTTIDRHVHDRNTPQISPTKVLDQSGDQSTADAAAPAAAGLEVLDAEIIDDDAATDGLFGVPQPSPTPPKRSRRKKPMDPEKRARLDQANDLADRYRKSKNKMVKFIAVRQIVVTALENYPYDAVFEGVKRMATADRDRPFTLDTLRSAIERASGFGPATVRRGGDPLGHLAPGDQIQVRTEFLKTRPNWERLARYGITPDNAALYGFRAS